MTINEHMTEFAGRDVVQWEPGEAVPNPATVMPRIGLTWEEEDDAAWTDKFGRYLETPGAGTTTGLVVGQWAGNLGEADAIERVVQAVVAARDTLPALNALFLGDVTYEESEISWIEQTDVSPLLRAYPQLEHFGVRGGNNLRLGPIRHDRLRTLIVEAGGLPRAVVHEVLAATLPQLEHLDLWLGTEEYGADTTLEDLAPLLAGGLFPRLRYLGLRDSDLTDEIAIALVGAPILERVEVLDLSLGTLSDAGAAALLANPAIARLRRLDLHHHYCSPEMVRKLQALPIEVDVSDPQEADHWNGVDHRFVAVGE